MGESDLTDRAGRRMEALMRHVAPQPTSGAVRLQNRAVPRQRTDVVKWAGWGYNDAGFRVNEKGQVQFSGDKYSFGNTELPFLRKFMEDVCKLDLNDYHAPPKSYPGTVPQPIVNPAFCKDIEDHCGAMSTDTNERIFRARGQTCYEMWQMRHGKIKRFPDLIVWPRTHEDVEHIVAAATRHNVALIPYGGGTSVSLALQCPPTEKRMIVSVDTSDMCEILEVNADNMTVRVQCGIVGQDLERKLRKYNFCCGHEPDSIEFSSLGGWIATRASGMKKNIYGNIEDVVVSFRTVTPRGVVERRTQAPRISAGPDPLQSIMGSEGTLGIVTEATIKVRPLPAKRSYASLVFPSFQHGVKFMRELAYRRAAPASVRLVDNVQFKFGLSLKQESASAWQSMMDAAKKFYVTQIRKFNPDEMCVCTLLFEGDANEVEAHRKRVLEIAAAHGGLDGGEENGRRGYTLTFVIAYLRDIGLDYNMIAESFETSCPWENVLTVCSSTKKRIYERLRELGVTKPPFVSARVTQTYDAGAAIYFYMGIPCAGLSDPCGTYHDVEDAAREEIIRCGGSISHHHGIGKLRKRFMADTNTDSASSIHKAVKAELDPKNIFAAGNIY